MQVTEPRAPRVFLRSWRESDAFDLFSLAGDPIIGHLAGFPPHVDVEDSRRVIHDVLSARGTYAIMSKDENALVGCISALPVKRSIGEREIGYWIGRRYWNRGFATAAVKTLLGMSFVRHELDCRRLLGRVREANEPSWRVLLKCGFELVDKDDGYNCYRLDLPDLAE